MYNMCIIYICMIMKASSWYLLSYSYLEWPCSSIARSPGSMWYITSVSLLVSDFRFPFFFCPASPSVPTRLFPSSFLYLPFFSVHQTASPPQASSDHENWKKRKDLFIWLLTRAKESQEWLPLMWNWTLSLIKQGFSLSLSRHAVQTQIIAVECLSSRSLIPHSFPFCILFVSAACTLFGTPPRGVFPFSLFSVIFWYPATPTSAVSRHGTSMEPPMLCFILLCFHWSCCASSYAGLSYKAFLPSLDGACDSVDL